MITTTTLTLLLMMGTPYQEEIDKVIDKEQLLDTRWQHHNIIADHPNNSRPDRKAKFNIDFGQLVKHDKLNQTQIQGRAEISYDCTENGEYGTDCKKPIPVDPPDCQECWPDWTDGASHFLPGVTGYLIKTDEDRMIWDTGVEAAKKWLQSLPNAAPENYPVLAHTGGSVYVIHHKQKPFFQNYKRICPSCFSYKKLSSVKHSLRDSIEMKLEFMKDKGAVPKWAVYDTVLFYTHPQTWNQYFNMQDDHFRLANYAQFIEQKYGYPITTDPDYFLNTDLVPMWQGMEGPSPEPEIVLPGKTTLRAPLWVKLRYADKIGKDILWGNEEWLAGGWYKIKRMCPDCERWEDWFFGNAELGLKGHGYLPGDRSIKDMIYTHSLRTGISFQEYLRREGPDDPYASSKDLFWLERKAYWTERNLALERAEKWVGREHNPINVEMKIKQEILKNDLAYAAVVQRRKRKAAGPMPNLPANNYKGQEK